VGILWIGYKLDPVQKKLLCRCGRNIDESVVWNPYLCILSAVTPVMSKDVGGKIVPGGAGSSCRLGRPFDGCDSLSEKEIKEFLDGSYGGI
jgi:hypothetical protein